MEIHLNSQWSCFLAAQIATPYFKTLWQQLESHYQEQVCFPPEDLIFAAFNQCALADLKVVIIGQDPYHGVGQANGLSFSVNDGLRIPPSLRNIYRELATDLDAVFMPTSGNLEFWAQQGVLLLNASLTVEKDKPNSHKHLKWNIFTDAVIQKIAEEKQGLVFLLWGAFAQQKGSKIDRDKHLVLTSGHPSPMSANQGKWFGNKHFSQTNAYLKKLGKKEIIWIPNLH
ncbi:uracil-DNA glycosylase [Flavobacterium crassostreae]|uniref:Uracil-DNA glycosylase n=1 Tax=Flavobacterium crassostreae TaxID=1763534 RepID=A0A1B9E9E5_9FLAO|nr:uracil-DNA glycosylase [Flavobacterium crassostreae]OCB78569.1 uracil-DNA glycosylase [Flavobacterium crassostreae]